MIYEMPKCEICKHRIEGSEGCAAFSVIPDSIYYGDVSHDKPIKGQENDIVFEETK
jgi:hypothetical protein